MENNVMDGEEDGIPVPAVSLEISSDIAEKAEELLGEFAGDAGLETALIVDRGGALVAGISSEEDVTVDVISGLVAGASSAMRALVDQLGDTGEIESLHQGGKRLLYIREIVTRFVLVGVSDASFPPGIVREKAAQLQPNLAELLRDVKPLDPPEPTTAERPKSLRAVAAERAAARVKVEILQKGSPAPDSEEENADPEETTDAVELASDPEPDDQDSVEEEFAEEQTTADTEEDVPPSEPVEVLEPIDLGEPEIVIAKSTQHEVEESPFEIEEDDDIGEEAGQTKEGQGAEGQPKDSIFELEDEEEEPAASEASVFEWVDEDEDEDSVEQVPDPEGDEASAETDFEIDGLDDEEEAEDVEETEDSEDEMAGSVPEEPEAENGEEQDDEETESRSSGPLYF